MKITKIAGLGCIAALALGTAASAQGYDRFRHDMYQPEMNSYDLTCGEARNLVRSRGSIVLDIGPHRYGRFVSSRRFCARGMEAEPAYIPTADRRQCFVGYRCQLRPGSED